MLRRLANSVNRPLTNEIDPNQITCSLEKLVIPRRGDQSILPIVTVARPTKASVRAIKTVSE